MALIKCPECDKEISDTAKDCPSCGFHIVQKGEKTKKVGKQMMATGCLLTFLVPVVIIIILAMI
jgi:DNA-directed RNA polymerase subunit RPC12/RpoP